jgi:hypothetical protein
MSSSIKRSVIYSIFCFFFVLVYSTTPEDDGSGEDNYDYEITWMPTTSPVTMTTTKAQPTNEQTSVSTTTKSTETAPVENTPTPLQATTTLSVKDTSTPLQQATATISAQDISTPLHAKTETPLQTTTISVEDISTFLHTTSATTATTSITATTYLTATYQAETTKKTPRTDPKFNSVLPSDKTVSPYPKSTVHVKTLPTSKPESLATKDWKKTTKLRGKTQWGVNPSTTAPPEDGPKEANASIKVSPVDWFSIFGLGFSLWCTYLRHWQ